GEVRASGRREDGEPWQVAIERPVAGRPQMQTSVPLVDASIATAGGYQKVFEDVGRRGSHIIGPATGPPLEHSLASVTVAANTCIAADRWDTPLLVSGPERGCACAEKNGIAALFIERTDAGSKMRATSEWRKRFPDKKL